ncbi:hypothetical protein CHRYSEOSP005_15170 [Chryseobacterium sp. Alg-005]
MRIIFSGHNKKEIKIFGRFHFYGEKKILEKAEELFYLFYWFIPSDNKNYYSLFKRWKNTSCQYCYKIYVRIENETYKRTN